MMAEANSSVDAVPPRSACAHVILKCLQHSHPEPGGQICQLNVIQHQGSGEQQGERIGNPLAGNVRRRPVDRLKDGSRLSNVGARSHSEASDKARDQVGQDITEKVRCDDHIELPRIHHKLHGARINDAIVHLHTAFVLTRDLPSGFQEKTCQRFQYVSFMNHGDFFTAMAKRILERKPYDAVVPRLAY